MPTKMSTKTPVTVAPMPTDRRVLSLAAALGMTTRNAWAVTAEAWAWLQAEAGDDGVVPGGPALLDAVADVEGLGAALVAAGLVGATAENIILPDELVLASRLMTRGAVVTERQRMGASKRQDKCRARKRLTGRTTTRKSTSTTASNGDQQPVQRRRPRRLGVACGHDVMLLDGAYGAFVQMTGADPKLTATAEGREYDTLSLADALDLLVPIHKSHEAPRGGYRVPTLQALEDAARLERERQRAAQADAARHDEGNAAFLEAAAEVDDDDHERDCHAPVTPVTRDTHDCHAPCHAPAGAESATSPNGDTGLDAGPCHAPCHALRAADAASSSSSSFGSSARAQIRTTTRTTAGSGPAFERDDRTPGDLDAVRDYRAKQKQARAERCAAALGVTVDEIRDLYAADREDLRRRLEAAGVDPNTGHPRAGHDGPGRPTSAAQAAGIPLPDLGVDRLRAVADQGGDHDRDGHRKADEAHDQDADVDDDHADRRVDEIHEPDVDLGVDDHAGAHEPADRPPSPATADAVS